MLYKKFCFGNTVAGKSTINQCFFFFFFFFFLEGGGGGGCIHYSYCFFVIMLSTRFVFENGFKLTPWKLLSLLT